MIDLPRLTPDLRALGLVALLILLAAFVGLIVGRVLGRQLETRVARNDLTASFTAHICPLVRAATVGLLLAAFLGLPSLGPGRLVLAAAFAVAVAVAAYHLLRGLRIVPLPAAIVAGVLLVMVAAGALGGLAPLELGLDAARLTLGKRSVTALDLVNAAIVVALLFGLTRLTVRLLTRSIGNATALDLSQRVLFQKIASIITVALAFFIGIDLLGIDLTALAVFSGALGLAIGFGLQKTFGNLIAGLILLMDRSIKPGDVIAIGDTFGWVNKIGVRYVSLLTRDGKEHLIPNEKLMTEPVENWSYTNKNIRLHVKVGVAHDCDIHLAQALMLEAVKGHPRVLDDPAPVCWLTGFGLSAIEHEIRVWIDDPEAGVTNVQSDILNRVWDLFRAHGIALPYNQHDVRVHRVNPAPSGLAKPAMPG